MKGKLFTIEGIDGSGKTTVTEKIYQELKEETNKEIIKTTEPSTTWLGEAVKKGLNREIDPIAEAFLFTSDHIEHVSKKIKPNLAEGKVVISDRYSDSFYAYQGVTIKDNVKNPIQYLIKLRDRFTIKPDTVFLLDLEPEEAFERLGENKIKFEKIDFLEKVRKNYKKLSKKEERDYITIDASRSIKKVKKDVLEEIKERINF
ncbi:MAG: Thymidylate kinase Tmk [Candidatus Methanohalarchaeum thermophilum]|uniref:Probable thymidylate kinase n=1 Tax=Methanohalarchaeum thermophilum TaxID=1903181 RepID=A0A1Q6DUX3_METT1|nr:MAG: Thymidylate kinase Tmk [Candidatus Methanohalarchaeum thermophilum]